MTLHEVSEYATKLLKCIDFYPDMSSVKGHDLAAVLKTAASAVEEATNSKAVQIVLAKTIGGAFNGN